MTRTACAALGLLACLTGCQRPAPLALPTEALHLHLNLRTDAPAPPELQTIWEEALRARMARQLKLAPTAAQASQAPRLEVRIEPLDRGQAVGHDTLQAAGRAFGAGWDTVHQEHVQGLSNHVKQTTAGLLGGTLCAIVVAPVRAAATTTGALAEQARLGYKPRHVVLTCYYQADPAKPAQEILVTRALEVVRRMKSMTSEEAHQPGRLAREEARAAADVLAEQLAQRGWHPRD